MKAYKTLNDAGFKPGKTKVWYWKPEVAGYYQKGYAWLRNEGVAVPDVRSLSQSHIKVGEIAERDPVEILDMMRRWSPSGEADELIHRLGLSHACMTVGDIIHFPGGRLLMVDTSGFAELGARTPPTPKVKPNPHANFTPADSHPSVESLVRRLLT